MENACFYRFNRSLGAISLFQPRGWCQTIPYSPTLTAPPLLPPQFPMTTCTLCPLGAVLVELSSCCNATQRGTYWWTPVCAPIFPMCSQRGTAAVSLTPCLCLPLPPPPPPLLVLRFHMRTISFRCACGHRLVFYLWCMLLVKFSFGVYFNIFIYIYIPCVRVGSVDGHVCCAGNVWSS